MSLCFLSEQLQFNVISELELKRSDDFKPAVDMRELIQQNENEFFAADRRTVCKFVKVNEKWIESERAVVRNNISKCLVLPNDYLLVVML